MMKAAGNYSIDGAKITLRSWGSNGRLYLEAKDAAKLVRVKLAKAFPGVKFSVRTSDGYSIHVRWTDGPTRDQADEIIDQYRAGRFDGMIDMAYSVYHWLNVETGDAVVASNPGSAGSGGMDSGYEEEKPGAEWIGVISGATYTSSSRDHSAEALMAAAKEVCKKFGHETVPELSWTKGWKDSPPKPYFENDYTVPLCKGSRECLAEEIHRHVRKMSFTEVPA